MASWYATYAGMPGFAGAGGPVAPDIQVRPEELLRTAETCYAVGTNLDGLLEEVHNIMTEFFNSDVFEGEQAANVRENYTHARENLDRFPQMIAWLGGKLEQASYAFSEADKDNITLYAETVFAATILPLLPAHMQDGFFTRMNSDPAFVDEVMNWLNGAGQYAIDNPREIGGALKAVKALRTLYQVNQGTNVVMDGFSLVTAGGQTASKFAKGVAVAGALITVGVGFYDAFTGADQSPEMIAAQITSGLVQAAMGFTVVGSVALATDAIIQFAGPIVADVMRDNADWLAGGGIDAADIIASADKFDHAIQDISLDARLDGTFKAIYSGDVLGVAQEFATFAGGVVDFMDSGASLAGYAAGGLINKLIPGAGGPVSAIVTGAIMGAYSTVTAPFRAFEFAVDLFSGNAELGSLVSGPANFIGDTLDMIGLSGAGDWVRDIGGTIAGGINTAVDATIQFAEDAWNAAQQAIADAARAAAEAAEAAANAIADAATTVWEAVSDPC